MARVSAPLHKEYRGVVFGQANCPSRNTRISCGLFSDSGEKFDLRRVAIEMILPFRKRFLSGAKADSQGFGCILVRGFSLVASFDAMPDNSGNLSVVHRFGATARA
jgi:hypothetical protein